MGGVGKSQLAAEYARIALASGEIDLLLWVPAASRAEVVSTYAHAAQDILGAELVDEEKAASQFLAWLTPKPGVECRWLVVLDDVADPADLRGLWPPESHSGQTLLTTRLRDEPALIGPDREALAVDVFTPAECVSYLDQVIGAHQRIENIDELSALANDLGRLPLALAQAAAYVVEEGITIAEYRKRLADRAPSLTDLLPEDNSLPDDQKVTVVAVWSLSIERADRVRPIGLAQSILQIASFLDPNGIPDAVLTSESILAFLKASRSASNLAEAESDSVTAAQARSALRTLHRLSLVEHNPAAPNQAIRVHQLVQRTTREQLSSDARYFVAQSIANALVEIWPEIERHSEIAQVMRSNCHHLSRSSNGALLKPAVHEVLFRLGKSVGDAGRPDAAAAYFARLLKELTTQSDFNFLDSLRICHEFADWCGQAGKYETAISILEYLLRELSEMIGSLHPNVFSTKGNIYHWQGMAGDPAGAVRDMERLLVDQLGTLEASHPHNYTLRYRLAVMRGRAGDQEAEVVELEKLLADQIDTLGREHPKTILTRKTIANARGLTVDAAVAVEDLTQILGDQVQLYGLTHPVALKTRHDLAAMTGLAGAPGDAASDLEQVLADQMSVLGPEHESVRRTLGNIYAMHCRARNSAGAISALERLLADARRRDDIGDSEILKIMRDLAGARIEAGDLDGAVKEYESYLESCQNILGPKHLDTLAARNNLAVTQGVTNHPRIAVVALESILADSLQALGVDHPQTDSVRKNLSVMRELAELNSSTLRSTWFGRHVWGRIRNLFKRVS
jgi:hypothetical protein